ncbi:MAG: hypothetical protein HOB40_05820 [Candidatus Marinimicrobia bacterium]|jgi:hypothetical protein|nr:hypothetical protein [Candidatus Neomarinimicrobiota bacterium]MBT3502452.1 hypothetical protein [Candidatus Neomarinimicrobiota bacterium]MBT3838662.1 hypothetical protein [Candidatus Neomarinimicrobiota bacterium]MBT3999728.1 hypothetical protein [Candidatus Neomarinimicrobiota bacterium]MBT4283371.1 hypothetical protein [Candidatus Neomarinimicrobiota bacterium]
MNKNKYLFIILSFGMLLAESQDEISPTFSDFQISSERYLTDEKGNIMMYVNIWGHVNAPGHHLVYEGIDMATMLSMVGGPRSGANLKKVRIYREAPDSDGKLQYQLNLQKFIQSGNRSEFIKIKPNDTIIIPEKITSVILTKVGTVNTFLGLFNLYFQLVK